MKFKLFFTSILLINSIVYSQTTDPRVGTPIKIGNIEVSGTKIEKAKFEWSYNYDEAVEKCKVLGDGWRIPTIDELTIINDNRLKVFGFQNSYGQFWSSTKNNKNDAYFMRIGNDPQIVIQGDWTECNLIVVRTVKK
jgi:hypothetical protein